MLADLARSDQEVEGGNDDSVMDLVAALMEEEEDTHSRDAFDLADCLVNEFNATVELETIREESVHFPLPKPLRSFAAELKAE